MNLGEVGCVIEGLVLGHVLVHILGLDLKEKAVSFRVKELAALSVLVVNKSRTPGAKRDPEHSYTHTPDD